MEHSQWQFFFLLVCSNNLLISRLCACPFWRIKQILPNHCKSCWWKSKYLCSHNRWTVLSLSCPERQVESFAFNSRWVSAKQGLARWEGRSKLKADFFVYTTQTVSLYQADKPGNCLGPQANLGHPDSDQLCLKHTDKRCRCPFTFNGSQCREVHTLFRPSHQWDPSH